MQSNIFVFCVVLRYAVPYSRQVRAQYRAKVGEDDGDGDSECEGEGDGEAMIFQKSRVCID